jgi:ribonucleoside-diphosphate reductase alpha chain
VTRNKLPAERNSVTHSVKIGTKSVYIIAGEYENGMLGELFIRIGKEGDEDSIYGALSASVSIGLQHGIPLQVYVDKFKYQRMGEGGPTNNAKIPMCDSVIDYVAKWLEMKYLPSEKGEE